MLEVEILGIVRLPGGGFPTVILRHEDRILLITIGLPEASAIQLALLGEKPPRPMTHDLVCNILAGLRGKMQSVTIYKMEEQTFFAYLTLEQHNDRGDLEQVLRVDTRPSDGIALALRTGCPIHVSEAVMEQAGHDAALLASLFESGEESPDDPDAEDEDAEGFDADDSEDE